MFMLFFSCFQLKISCQWKSLAIHSVYHSLMHFAPITDNIHPLLLAFLKIYISWESFVIASTKNLVQGYQSHLINKWIYKCYFHSFIHTQIWSLTFVVLSIKHLTTDSSSILINNNNFLFSIFICFLLLKFYFWHDTIRF